MSEQHPSIPLPSQQNESLSENVTKELSENEAQKSIVENASVSENKKSENNKPSESGLPVSKIAKPTGLKLPSVGASAPVPSRISRLCNNIPKPAVPILPSPVAKGTGFGEGGAISTMSSIRKISDELARKRLTDVDEADENSVPFFGVGKWTVDRKMSSGSVLSDSSRKSSSDELRKKRSSGASLSADSYSDYWKPDFESRRASDASVVLTEDTDQFIIGDRVWVGGIKPGQIAYIGETQFAPGEWAGIVLDEPIGKNDGTVANIRYFQCEPKKGIFSRLTRLTRYPLVDGGAGEPAVLKSYSPETRKSNGSLLTSVPKKSSLILTPPPKNFTSKPSSPDSALHPGVAVGDRVIVKSSQGSKAGILRYLGATDFAAGEWCGVELDDPLGKNDGSVSGTRYFECRPKFGLFAPLHKVSKSPANKRPSQASCAIHRGGAAPGLKKQGSKESLVSLSSTTSTTASVKSASRVRPSSTLNSSLYAQKIGVRTPTTPTSTKIALQETLKEKELHIEQLLKERDLERAEVTRAASQADEAERQLACLKQEYEQQKEEAEARVSDLDAMIFLLKSQNDELANQLREEKTKYEDLQFRFEEESIEKADIKSVASQYEERISALEKMLAEERKKTEFLEQDSNKLFEAEEQMVILKDEIDNMKLEIQDHQAVRSTMEQERISLEAHLTSARAEIESLKIEIESLKTSASEGQTNLSENLTKALQNLEENKKKIEEKEKEIDRLSAELQAKSDALDEKEKELHSKYLTIINELTGKHDIEVSKLNENIEILKNNSETKLKVLESQLEEKIKMCNLLEGKLNEQHISMAKASEEKVMEQTKQKEKEEKLQEAFKMKSEELEKKEAQLNDEIIKREELFKKAEKYQQELMEMKNMCSLTSESTSKQVSELNEIINKQKDELGLVKEEAVAKHKQCEELRQNIIELQKEKEKKISDLEKMLMEKESALEKVKEEYQQTKLEFGNKNQELKNLFNSHEEDFKIKIKNLEEAEAEKQKEVENLLKNLESLKNSLEVRESEVRNEQINNKNLMTKFLALEENYKAASEEKDQLQLENGDLIGRLQFAEQKLAESNNQKAKLEADISNFINSSNDSSHQLNKLNEDLRTKEKELDVMREEISQKSRNFERMEQELKQSLQKQETQIKTYQEDEERMKQNYEQEIESLKNKIQSSNIALKKMQEVCQKKVATFASESGTQIKDLEEKIRYMEKKEVEDRMKYEENMNELLGFKNELEKKLMEAELMGSETQKALEKQIEELNIKNSILVETVEKTNNEFLINEKNLLEKVKKESDQYECESEKLRKELKETHEKLETTIEELGKAKEEKNKLNEEKSKLETSSVAMEELLKQTQMKNMELEVTAASVESENKLLKETINQLREEKCHMDKDTTDKMLLVTELKSQLAAFENSKKIHDADNEQKMKSLQEEILGLKEKLQKTESAQSVNNFESSKIIDNLKLELEKLKQESSQVILLKDKDIENINVVVRQLRKDLEINMRESESKSKKISELDKSLDELKMEVQAETRKSEEYGKRFNLMETEKLNLKEKLEEQSKLMLSNNDLIGKLEETKKKLAEAENKQKEETNNLMMEKKNLEKMVESKSALLKERENEAKILAKEVEMLKLEKVSLMNNNQILVQNWEKEKCELQKKVEASKQTHTNTNANAESQEDMDEREFAKGQVDFLNSVIVDMQKKNDALKARIEILEMGFSPEDVDEFNLQNINPRNVAPRLFCDICDRFDLHDTEDCPTQAMDDEPPPKPSKSKVPPPERPYCDICEVFGHDTADCDDAETF